MPSGRDLAKTLGFSHATCCKALQRMVREGFIKNYPQKGHYAVPKYLHCRKIGLILGGGEESPFVRDAPTLPNAIRHLNGQGFDVQIIQHSRLEKLYDNAVIHGVEGILWFWPADRARTPREYLALVAAEDPRHAGLASLTGSFERTWYGGRAAAESDYLKAEELAASLIAGGSAAGSQTPEGGAR